MGRAVTEPRLRFMCRTKLEMPPSKKKVIWLSGAALRSSTSRISSPLFQVGGLPEVFCQRVEIVVKLGKYLGVGLEGNLGARAICGLDFLDRT